MSIYLIRNPATGKWLTDNVFECEDPDTASRRFNSEKAARKCIRQMVTSAQDRNSWYEADPQRKWEGYEPRAEHYEVVAFRLVEVGSLG